MVDGLFNLDQLALSGPLLNLLIGIVLSIAFALYYALSNRPKFARLLPRLCLITVFIISVIKGSLALSLESHWMTPSLLRGISRKKAEDAPACGRG